MGTNTGIGIGIGIPFKNNALGGDRPYLPPELKARLIGVWDNYGKKNTDADRNIIKNKIPNAGGDLEILNAAYEGMSGCNGYPVVFGSNKTWESLSSVYSYTSDVTSTTIHITRVKNAGVGLLFSYVKKDGALTNIREIPAFRVTVKGLEGNSKFGYRYLATEDATRETLVYLGNGTHELSKSFTPTEALLDLTSNAWVGIFITPMVEGEVVFDCDITIEVLPEFEGAFVTDGIDDLITSAKTVQEMLGGSNEITVVSMIHQIGLNCMTNFICDKGSYWRCNEVANTGEGKTGIYGYSSTNLSVNTSNIINNVLGDKVDYSVTGDRNDLTPSQFSVVGYTSSNGGIAYISSIAWYWTIIANKVLTTDQINQVIAYFNLDRTLKPDILCNTIKQGITNENHAEFGDKLIDYSGNGRDIQLNNIAWDGDSGIGKYNYPNWKVNVTQGNKYARIVYYDSINGTYSADFKGMTDLYKSYGLSVEIRVNRANTIDYHSIKEDGIYTVTPPDDTTSIDIRFGGENVYNASCDITITQIPSHAGGLCLDGVNDFGKVTGLPIYKDYTVVADYERLKINIGVDSNSPIISKSESVKLGAFIFNTISSNGDKVSYSFGRRNIINTDDTIRKIFYQSKYINDGQDINIESTFVDSDKLWLGTYRDNDYRFFNGAIYSLMSFPYSMSEFLIERQLKKHKLGTLYPNMVEFRPVIKANANYKITYYQIDSTNTWKSIKVGDYIVIGAKLAFQITFDNDASELKEVVSPQLSGIIVEKRPSNPGYNIYSYITSKSPQKINITIDEYIRYENIVQPYPVLLRFKDENGNEVSWGGKFKVGSTITRIGSAVDSNLLPNIYNIFGLLLNDNQVTSSKVIVEKTMVFKAKSAYIFDNNEPKCILSPSRLRIPNSSYKILGYIPDISGHGNNGVIHNSAYAEGSGVNEDGSYQFDGVDDFVTIPTLSSGGKQVLMKVNSLNSDVNVIYDQRLPTNMKGTFAIMCDNNLAYSSWNTGQTYIDGILNKNIIGNQLVNITHNLTITNDGVTNNNSKSPFIGKSTDTEKHANMSLYDFMLFDDISTEDKIKELNEYVGIEAKVELPPYYWDAYGKTNLDGDKATIQQRGVAVGDYDLTNSNFAYEGMSGYNGYPVVFGANKTWEQMPTGTFTWNIDDNKLHITKALIAGNGLLFSYVKLNGSLLNVKEIPSFKIKVSGLEGKSKLWYRYLKTEDAISETIAVLENGTHELPKSYTPSDSLHDGVWIGFTVSPISEGVKEFDCDITIEVLPEYENGLVYDGITDYSKNANIPALDDFTAIIKREWLKKQGCPLIKGSKVYEGGNGNALLLEWDKAYNFVFYKRTDIMEGKLPDNISFITPTNYNGNVITRGSEQDTNGICIAGDGNAGFANMVFYKLILYPKTIPLLQINFLKNLMEKDEIIDLNNPIFIKDE